MFVFVLIYFVGYVFSVSYLIIRFIYVFRSLDVLHLLQLLFSILHPSFTPPLLLFLSSAPPSVSWPRPFSPVLCLTQVFPLPQPSIIYSVRCWQAFVFFCPAVFVLFQQLINGKVSVTLWFQQFIRFQIFNPFSLISPVFNILKTFQNTPKFIYCFDSAFFFYSLNSFQLRLASSFKDSAQFAASSLDLLFGCVQLCTQQLLWLGIIWINWIEFVWF